MKKQVVSILTATLILAEFTACRGAPTTAKVSDNTSENNSSSFEVVDQSSDPQSESSVQSVPESKPDMVLSDFDTNAHYMFDPQITENTQRLIDEFPRDSVTAPDGSKIDKSEAIYAIHDEDAIMYGVGFDFSYIRYVEPIFYNSVDDPELVDWEKREFKNKEYDRHTIIEEPNYFKVRAGDKLENGLTVKTALCWYGSGDHLFINKTVLEGELTLTGFLYYDAESRVEGKDIRFVYFDPDPTQCAIPTFVHDDLDMVFGWIDDENDFALVSEHISYFLGEVIDIPFDLSAIPAGEYIKVKAKLKDIYLVFAPGASASCATLVDFEII